MATGKLLNLKKNDIELRLKLNEKYILAEKRHLIERYILTEADEGLRQQFQSILTEISNKYKRVKL